MVGVHGNLQGGADTLEARREAMGISWLSNLPLTQAIPPAYTEHIGRQLIAWMAERATRVGYRWQRT